MDGLGAAWPAEAQRDVDARTGGPSTVELEMPPVAPYERPGWVGGSTLDPRSVPLTRSIPECEGVELRRCRHRAYARVEQLKRRVRWERC
jgi:hypothetical protein